MGAAEKATKKGPLLKGANQQGRKVLGRGLASLMSTTAVKVEGREKQASTGPDKKIFNNFNALDRELDAEQEGLRSVPLEALRPAAAQPRKRFTAAELDELAQSIRTSGLLQPILVRPVRDGKFEIVAGERRWRAAQSAGLTTVPVTIRELSDRDAFAVGLIENIQRENLDPIEEALAYQRLVEDYGETQVDVARSVGKDRVSVANALRLLKLPSAIQDLLSSGKLSAGHGRALLMVDDAHRMEELSREAVRMGLSVRALERLVSEGEPQRRARAAEVRPPNLAEVEERLRRALGTKVTVRVGRGGRGELRVSFFSPAELERLLERLQV